MFFVLSKTLGLLALPTNFMIVLGLLGVVLMLTRFAVFGRRLVVAAMLLLAVLGYWLIGFPASYVLGLRTALGATGIWIGLSLGTAIYAALLVLRFLRLSR